MWRDATQRAGTIWATRPTSILVPVVLATLAMGAGFFLGVARGSGEPAASHFDGIGGVFFRVKDPEAFKAWYRDHLGIDAGPFGATLFWRKAGDPQEFGRTVWAPFPRDTDYFGPGDQQIMINYRVRDLDGLLRRLAAAGVQQVGGVEEFWYGRFAWIVDLEGNRVELWEPVDLSPEVYQRKLREAAER